jgi:hypothetical protein
VGVVMWEIVGVGLACVSDGSEVGLVSIGVGSGVGLGSVGVGSEVAHGSVGEGSAVGLGSAGEGSAVGLGSAGDGSAAGLGSAGEGSGVGLGSAGDGSAAELGSAGEGSGVGLVSVGEGAAEGEGLSVGTQVSARDDVGSVRAIARPPSAEPRAAVVASTARTHARRLTAVTRVRAAVTRRRCGLSTDPSALRSRSTTLSRLPGHPQG